MSFQKVFLTAGFCLISQMCFLQVSNPKVDTSAIFFSFDLEPEFPGGRDSLMNFLRDNFIPPDELLELNLSGKVIVRFVVEEDGSVTHPVIEKSFKECQACDVEALRLIGIMPKWIPVNDRNKSTKRLMRLPINFESQ